MSKRILLFLKKTYPFSEIREEDLMTLLENSEYKRLVKGEFVFTEGENFKGVLFIVASGLVELFVYKGEKKVLLGYRGEGEIFGEDSFFTGDSYRYNAVCIEPTELVLLNKAVFESIIEKYGEVGSYIAALLSKRLEAFYNELKKELELPLASPFLKRVSDIFRYRKSVFVDRKTTVWDIARIMDNEKITSVLVGSEDSLCGIVTERDLVVRFLARREGDRAEDIMTHHVLKTTLGRYCYEVLVDMVKNNIRHIVVEDNGKVLGVLDITDFIEKDVLSYIDILTKVEEAKDVNELKRVSEGKITIIKSLVEAGVSVREICNIITYINDELVRKAVRFAIEKVGKELPFCFLVLGSHGRKEQTIKTDQDNALIYPDELTCELDTLRRIAEYSVSFLETIGFKRCPANVMATSPDWFGSKSEWIKRLEDLFSNPVPEKILKFSIIFDNRVIFGDDKMELEFYKTFVEGIRMHPGFIAHLGKEVELKKPPIGLFGNFIVEKSGEHKDSLDIKLRGIMPIFESVRLLALIHGVKKVNTFERLEELREKGAIDPSLSGEVMFAYEFLTRLRLLNHIKLIEEGKEPHDFINPKELTTIEKKLLKESFAVVYKIQREAYKQSGAAFIY